MPATPTGKLRKSPLQLLNPLQVATTGARRQHSRRTSARGEGHPTRSHLCFQLLCDALQLRVPVHLLQRLHRSTSPRQSSELVLLCGPLQPSRHRAGIG
jgi:hypothetical protein